MENNMFAGGKYVEIARFLPLAGMLGTETVVGMSEAILRLPQRESSKHDNLHTVDVIHEFEIPRLSWRIYFWMAY